jgi:adenine-specific DNA methylase
MTSEFSYLESKFPARFLSRLSKDETHARRPIYTIHRWWARRPGTVFRGIILGAFSGESLSEEHFKQLMEKRVDLNGRIIVDPFMGGGTTIIEGLRLGCKVIGIELNPVAWFLTKKEVEEVNIDEIRGEFKKLEEKVGRKIKEYYKTICSKCKGQADVINFFWVRKIRCEKCNGEVKLFPNFKLAELNKDKFIVFCPRCYEIFNAKKESDKVVCTKCNETFSPLKGYAEGTEYTCSNCGHSSKILKALKRMGEKPSLELFAVEFYCPTCDLRGYKKADEKDLALYKKAAEEFNKRKDELLFPRQIILPGKETKRLLNHNFKYFYEFFNERQLLCLSMLLEAILEIEDENLKEFFLLAFSHSLDFNNMFARYNQKARKIEPMFAHHAFYPKKMPTENNVWGTRYGRCSFTKCVSLLIRGKSYCENPFEFVIKGKNKKKVYTGETIKGKLASNFEELAKGEKNVLLLRQSSEILSFIPDCSVDAVITDPPYFDNVMYSELADFYYIWLHLALKDFYECFKPEYSPRTDEIVVNSALRKNEESFINGLTKVFQECHRILKNDGLMAFTFHHKKDEAWASVLEAVTKAGFYITSVIPVYAEMSTSFHIYQKMTSVYDTVIVCRKKVEPSGKISLEEILERTVEYTKKSANDLLAKSENFLTFNILMVARSKFLELYSKHYPNIETSDKLKLSINELLKIVDNKVYEILKTIKSSKEETTLERYL